MSAAAMKVFFIQNLFDVESLLFLRGFEMISKLDETKKITPPVRNTTFRLHGCVYTRTSLQPYFIIPFLRRLGERGIIAARSLYYTIIAFYYCFNYYVKTRCFIATRYNIYARPITPHIVDRQLLSVVRGFASYYLY